MMGVIEIHGGQVGGVAVSADANSQSTGTISFANSNGVTFGLSNDGVMTASVQTNYLTTAMASNRGSDFVQANAVFHGTSASGTIASNAISISIGPYLTTAMASNRGSDFVQANAAFHGTNASGTIASNAISISVAPPGGGAGYTAGLSDIGPAFGTTGLVSNRLVFVANGAGAWSQSTDAGSATLSVILIPPFVTNVGNTAGDTGLWLGNAILVGSNNITLSVGTISESYTGVTKTHQLISFIGPTQSAESQSIGMSTQTAGGATAGTTGYAQGAQVLYHLVPGSNITMSQSINGASGTLSVYGVASQTVQTQNMVVVEVNGANGTATFSSGTLDIHAGNNITLSTGANAFSIHGASGGGGLTFSSSGFGGQLPGGSMSSASFVQNFLYLYPEQLHAGLACSIVKIPIGVTNSSSAFAAHTRGYTAHFAVYSRHSTNQTVLTLHYSTSHTMSFFANSNASWRYGVVTAIGNSTSYNTISSSSGGLNLSSNIHGVREIIFPLQTTLTAGEYWFAFRQSSSSSGAAGNLFNVSNIYRTYTTHNQFHVAQNATLNGAYLQLPQGIWTSTTASPPNAISFSQINQAGIQFPIFALNSTN